MVHEWVTYILQGLKAKTPNEGRVVKVQEGRRRQNLPQRGCPQMLWARWDPDKVQRWLKYFKMGCGKGGVLVEITYPEIVTSSWCGKWMSNIPWEHPYLKVNHIQMPLDEGQVMKEGWESRNIWPCGLDARWIRSNDDRSQPEPMKADPKWEWWQLHNRCHRLGSGVPTEI